MNTLAVLDNQEITIQNQDDEPAYLLYSNGRAFFYQPFGHLGNLSIHLPDNSGSDETKECEFFNNIPCDRTNKTVGPMTREEAFAYMRERAGL
jgi:hypothetical protein